MSAAREEILARIRVALRDVPEAERPEDVAVPRTYRHQSSEPAGALVERFAERLREYRADVERVSAGAVAQAVERACARWRLRHLVVAPALPEAWRPRGVALVDDTGLTASDLDDIDGALTGCALAIAETGTIVLDGQGSSGRRAITLIPDHHICVIEAAQVTGSVPEAVAALAEAVTRRRAPITMVSGPSASSDIELTRIEGVHGPRHLLALVVDGR